MLMENGCDDFALNLATWCTKSPIFQSDPYIRQAQLLLLIKLNRQEEFHNAVSGVTFNYTAITRLSSIVFASHFILHLVTLI